jgi:hypothetical protein
MVIRLLSPRIRLMLARILTSALVVATALSLFVSAEGLCCVRATGTLQRRTLVESGWLTSAVRLASVREDPGWLPPTVMAIPSATWLAVRPSPGTNNARAVTSGDHSSRPRDLLRAHSRQLLVLRT